MKIERVTKFVLDKKEFENTHQVQDYIGDIIGTKVIDKLIKVCPPLKYSDTIKMLVVLTKDREVRDTLIKYLSIEINAEPNTIQGCTKNIFDV